MSRKKTRTSISLPEELLAAIDLRAKSLGRTRSDLVCEAMNHYFASEEEKLLAAGYQRMARESREDAGRFESAVAETWPEW